MKDKFQYVNQQLQKGERLSNFFLISNATLN